MKLKTFLACISIASALGIGQLNSFTFKASSYKENSLDVSSLKEERLYEMGHEESHINCLETEKEIHSNIALFEFVSDVEINRVESDLNNHLLSFNIIDGTVKCQLVNLEAVDEIKLSFFNGANLVDVFTLYFAQSDEGTIYSSALSLDTAKRNAGIELGYGFEVTEETTNQNETGLKPVKRAGFLGIGATGRAYGTFRWTDDQDNMHPLVNAKVTLSIGGSWWTKTAYTDQYGQYDISYDGIWYIGSGKLKITLALDNGSTVKVINSSTYSTSSEMSGSNGTYSFSRNFSPAVDGDFGRSCVIFQAADAFAQFATTMNGGDSVKACSFLYPGDPTEGCYYSSGYNKVTITSKPRSNTSLPNSYAAFDVIGHEYGHHIQNIYGITANPGGTHYIHHNNIDDQYDDKKDDGTRKYTLEQSKDRGLKLAWGEGWPTFWSTVAQTTFSSELKGVATVADTEYISYNGVKYDLDAYADSTSYGDADECAVQRVLYKLYSPTKDSSDNFNISFDSIWQLVKSKKPHTFYAFINNMYEAGYNKHDLGKLLARYRMTVGGIEIKNNYLDMCPTFTWSTYMGSDYLRFDNFDLVFTNPRGQEVVRINNIYSIGLTASYTLTKSEWASIIAIYGRKYYAYVIARQTDSFISGPYYSETFDFYEPDDFNIKTQIKPNEWGFEPQYYFESNRAGHSATTITDHGLTITTNRLRCGYIEDSYVVLSPRRKNAGKAYLELYFDQAVFSYMFGITLWSSNEGLNASDCTALVQSMDEQGNWTTDFDLFRDLPNGFSTKGTQIDRYETRTFGVFGLRFVLTAPAVGDRNKGRLCIDDIVLNTNPNDPWFISTFYE